MLSALRRSPGDLVLAVVLLIIGIIYVVGSTRMPQATVSDVVGPGYFPWLIGVAWVICAAVYLVLVLAGNRLGRSDTGEADSTSRLRLFGMIGLTFGYAVAIDLAGYVISTLVFAVLGLVLLGRVNPVALVLFPTAITLILYLIFVELLGVLLPLFPF